MGGCVSQNYSQRLSKFGAAVPSTIKVCVKIVEKCADRREVGGADFLK